MNANTNSSDEQNPNQSSGSIGTENNESTVHRLCPYHQMLFDYIEIKTYRYKHEASNDTKDCTFDCGICLSPIAHQEFVRRLPCLHIFHALCIDMWLLRGKLDCPYCRGNITGIDDV
ncbi:E3 ubiquitin-protein ligase [Pseudolycoriella hygida]|uniref:E3 ubiquitin-protein ligase n=1 Tax=Pseudolycoriella hygida TaxID=35572 RepID=A0A9Q0S810_9DIPT|nr:E3 ubiquitin-protein ligase [Pseudolycoriella hygida]